MSSPHPHPRSSTKTNQSLYILTNKLKLGLKAGGLFDVGTWAGEVDSNWLGGLGA